MSHNAKVVSIVPELDDERKAAFITQCLQTLNIVLTAQERAFLDAGVAAVGGVLKTGKHKANVMRGEFDRYFRGLDAMGGEITLMFLELHAAALNLMISVRDLIKWCVDVFKKRTGPVNADLVLKISCCVADYALDNSVVCDLARLEEPVTEQWCMGTLCEDMEAFLRQHGTLTCGGGNLTEGALGTVMVNGVEGRVCSLFRPAAAATDDAAAAGAELD
jgi:hypothetical protein